MSVEFKKYVQEPMLTHDEWLTVSGIADQLHEHLNRPGVLEAITSANQPRVSSADLQATFLDFAKGLGFESEKTGLFADLDLAVRPDYFLRGWWWGRVRLAPDPSRAIELAGGT
jgi:hypothetical protein